MLKGSRNFFLFINLLSIYNSLLYYFKLIDRSIAFLCIYLSAVSFLIGREIIMKIEEFDLPKI